MIKQSVLRGNITTLVLKLVGALLFSSTAATGLGPACAEAKQQLQGTGWIGCKPQGSEGAGEQEEGVVSP